MRILVNDHAGHPLHVQLSRALSRRGHDVMHTYCEKVQTPRGTLRKLSGDPDTFHIQGISIGGEFKKYGLISRWWQERTLGDQTANVISEFKPDVVLSGNTPLVTQSKLLAATHQQRARFIFWLQDVLSIGIGNALRQKLPVVGGIISAHFERLEHDLWRKSDHVVVITDDFTPSLLEAGVKPNNVTTIENWAPLDELPLLDKNNSWSLHHDLTDKKCFLYSGTLGLKHNPSYLLSLAVTFADRPEISIIVITEGQGADFLREQKQVLDLDNLLVMDFQPYDQMPEVLATGDVLVALLEADAGSFAVPSKVLTYLCAKRALLLAVPPDNLVARIVQENEAGMVSAPEEEDAFIANAIRLMDNPELREKMAVKGRSYAERTFDIDRIAENFESIFLGN